MKRIMIRLMALLGSTTPVVAHGSDVTYMDGHMVPWIFGFGAWHMILWLGIIALAIYGAIKLFERKKR